MKLSVPLAIIVFLFLGCGNAIEDRILGSWGELEGNDIITFYADGTLYIQDGQNSVTGEYHFIDKTHVKFKFKGIAGAIIGFREAITGEPLIFEVRVNSERLALVSPDGTVAEFERISKK